MDTEELINKLNSLSDKDKYRIWTILVKAEDRCSYKHASIGPIGKTLLIIILANYIWSF